MGTHVKVDNKVLVRDRNRFRKVYRYIRKKPDPLECDDGTQISDFVWGAYFVEFNHQHEVEHYFPCCYNLPPAVIATTVSKSETASTWTDADGAGPANITYKFANQPSGPTDFNYSTSTSAASKPGGPTIQTLLNNLWWDFSNADGTVWRLKIQGSSYPAGHNNPNVTRTVNKTFEITVAASATVGAWITNFISAVGSTTVSGEKFSDKWQLTTTDGPADITFTAKTGNKGPLAALVNPDPPTGDPSISVKWVDTYVYERTTDTGSVPDAIALQTGFNNGTGGTGSGSSGTSATNSNFNTFVTDITNEKCIFRTSGYFTGYVHYQALKDGVYTMPDIGRTMEVKTLSYTNTNTKEYTFTVNDGAGFVCTPIVTATADQDVNVFITSLSKTKVTVEVSQSNFTGNVFIQAIEKGC